MVCFRKQSAGKRGPVVSVFMESRPGHAPARFTISLIQVYQEKQFEQESSIMRFSFDRQSAIGNLQSSVGHVFMVADAVERLSSSRFGANSTQARNEFLLRPAGRGNWERGFPRGREPVSLASRLRSRRLFEQSGETHCQTFQK